jgi:prepilin-type N-terminal cleavage/methylation domain-containing protein
LGLRLTGTTTAPQEVEDAAFRVTAMSASCLKSNRGFTIMEVMIAAAILGLVLASAIALGGQAVRYVADIRRTARASQVLQQKVEDIRLLSWSQLAALPSTFTDPNDTAGIYSGTVSQIPYDSFGGATTLVKLTVTVTWTNQAGVPLTKSLTTVVSNGGLNKYIY